MTRKSKQRRRRGIFSGIIKWPALYAGVLCLCLGLLGCITDVTPEPAPGNRISSVYEDVKVKPLQPADCGRCHQRIFGLLKNKGGRHRIDCQRCHVQFHTYYPGKVPYQEVLPKCESCHDQVHGKELARCSGCHSEVHSPMSIPAGRALDQGCFICHPGVDKEMKTYLTRHTEFYCSSCHHTRHRYVPECQECHQPHVEGMSQSECLTCHSPHKALQVTYPEDTSDKACVGCHRIAFVTLKESNTKHSAVNCTKCHPQRHRGILRCQQCHNQPHPAAILQKFSVCNQCHGAAHSLCQGAGRGPIPGPTR
jgi:predicted CXXCH cytochrome family protein